MDEGTLHALLDGTLRIDDPEAAAAAEAHLADCESCRARLRAAAGGTTTPGGVRRHAQAVHRRERWVRGIIWAASLVLALGTGYLLRGLVDRPAADERVESPAAAPAPASEAAEAGPEPSADAAAGLRTEPRAESGKESLLDSPAASPSLPAVGASGAVAGVQWSVATLAEARAAMDGPVYRLPRAEITEIYVESIGDSDTRPRLMTMQRLATGIPLQVVQRWGESAAQPGEATAEREADDGNVGGLPQPESVRVTRGAYILEVTGSLPRELLEILAESATPAT